LETFLFEVVEHLSRQYTAHERERFWIRQAHSEPAPRGRTESLFLLRRPPADTLVLLGYARSEEHLRWVSDVGIYNIRADARRGAVSVDSRELAAELLVLYGPPLRSPVLFLISGSPRILTKDDLIELGYPKPGGQLYFCIPIEISNVEMVHIPSQAIESLQREKASTRGEPVAVTWADVLKAAEQAGSID
jgi:hypothetical protein